MLDKTDFHFHRESVHILSGTARQHPSYMLPSKQSYKVGKAVSSTSLEQEVLQKATGSS